MKTNERKAKLQPRRRGGAFAIAAARWRGLGVRSPRFIETHLDRLGCRKADRLADLVERRIEVARLEHQLAIQEPRMPGSGDGGGLAIWALGKADESTLKWWTREHDDLGAYLAELQGRLEDEEQAALDRKRLKKMRRLDSDEEKIEFIGEEYFAANGFALAPDERLWAIHEFESELLALEQAVSVSRRETAAPREAGRRPPSYQQMLAEALKQKRAMEAANGD